MQITLIMSSIFSFVCAAIFGYVGIRLQQRTISSAPAARAWRMFLIWWYSLSVGTLVSGLLNFAAAFGFTDLGLFVAVTYLTLLLLCVGLACLLYYLIYLFTGSSRPLPFLAIFYAACFLLLVYYINSRVPTAVSVGPFNVSLTYQLPPGRPIVAFAILMMVYFPQIFSGFAYFGLYFRLSDATQKYRVLLVSWSIILWFFSAFSATVAGVSVVDWWQIVSRVIGIVAAGAIFTAYFPPGYLQQRLGVKPITQST